MSTRVITPAQPLARRRLLEAAMVLMAAVAIALVFWTQQRYPSLLTKLHAGQHLQARGAISFDALLPVTPAMPMPERIARTSVNWLWTNRFGMYFALPFGAAMMTFLTRTRPKRFASPAGNVLCGAVAGMPLGVCANCATPIGQGLIVAGASTRMTVAAMISSPSFNPVVIAMAFVLFPLPLAWLRVLAPAVLLVSLPLLVKENDHVLRPISFPQPGQTVARQVRTVLASFARNFLRLCLLTLPWMLLAAVLGAILAEAIPAYGTHIPVSIPGIAAVALVGTLLPVPMAFDVALAFVLYRSGVPVPYVAAFLCTLGPVSVYSLTALGHHCGKAAAVRLLAATASLGFIAGAVALWL